MAAGAVGGRDGDEAGERRAEPGLCVHSGSASPGALRGRLPRWPRPLLRGLAGAGEAAGTALRGPQSRGRHGVRRPEG